jgi:hypothetical protein
MPDAIARAAVNGAEAIIRPLELLGIKQAQTLKVPGVYLIGSPTNSAAPLMLIAPHSPRHSVKEYKNEAQLLAELKSRGPLLDWVLMNLPQPERMHLEYRMMLNPQRVARAASTNSDTRPAEVKLASSPLTGHLFKHLFNDNAALLSRLLGCQSDDKKHSEWTIIKQVLGEDLHEAFSFCMGKLAYPLTVWRSYRDIKQSAEDLQTHKWAAAIREFISGISQLAALRQSLGEQTSLSLTPAVPTAQTSASRFDLHHVDITAPERTQLSRHECTDLDLGSMTHGQ